MNPFIVLADDLTGAMETGLALSKVNTGRTAVVMDSNGIAEAAKASAAIVYDSETRNLSQADCTKKILDFAGALKACGLRPSYKKMDSTLRGHAGLEISVTVGFFDFDAALIVPALPKAGRTTIGGVHYVGGSPITQTELSRDPFAPVRFDRVEDAISDGCCEMKGLTAVLPLADIRRDAASALRSLIAAGNKYICADCETELDLEILSEALVQVKNVLPCGSAGLLEAMSNDVDPAAPKMEFSSDPATDTRGALIVCGSPAKVSKQQLRRAEEKAHMAVVSVDRTLPEIGGVEWEAECSRCFTELAQHMQNGRPAAFDSAGDGKDAISDAYRGREDIMKKAAALLRESCAGAALYTADKGLLRGLVVIGGETAADMLSRAGTDYIEVLGEAEALLPLGVIRGGKLSEIPIVTKAGGFGTQDCLINAVTAVCKCSGSLKLR